MREHPLADWDPRDQRVLEHQRTIYDEMRERCPVAYSDFLHWSLFRHQDIVAVLAEPEVFSSASHHLAVPNGMDPPEHTRYRQALEPAFTPERMEALEPACHQLAGTLMQGLLAHNDVEVMVDYAQPFSLKTLCIFMGWPEEDWEFLRGWTHGSQRVAFAQNREAGAALAYSFGEFVKRGLQTRRDSSVETDDDLLSRLMATEVAGNALSDEEIISLLRNWTAGHGTVAAALGILIACLADDVALQHRMRADPALLPAAIDEILRANGPLVANRRTTTRDVEIEGRTIHAGDRLSLMWIAANRDARVFADPDEICLARDQAPNLLFGHGIHDCLGAPLARLELQVALETLLAQTEIFTRNDAAPVSRAVYPSNGFQELHLRLH